MNKHFEDRRNPTRDKRGGRPYTTEFGISLSMLNALYGPLGPLPDILGRSLLRVQQQLNSCLQKNKINEDPQAPLHLWSPVSNLDITGHACMAISTAFQAHVELDTPIMSTSHDPGCSCVTWEAWWSVQQYPRANKT